LIVNLSQFGAVSWRRLKCAVDEQVRAGPLVRWEDAPEKSLGLVVPFGCSLDNVKEEAAKAVKAVSTDLASATVVSP
jgi:hypothetical protein